jgi:hypothetical protein
MKSKATSRSSAALLGLATILVVGAGEEPKTWDEDCVTIRTSKAPCKRRDFVIDIPAPVDQVWRSLTTAEGIQEFLRRSPTSNSRSVGITRSFPACATGLSRIFRGRCS